MKYVQGKIEIKLINQLTNEFSMNQLQVMGKGCNKEVRKYELRSY